MNERIERQIAGLKAAGHTVIGTFEREGGGTVVLIVCRACGLARSPDHRCPYCDLKEYDRLFAEMQAALGQVSAGVSTLQRLSVR